MKLNSGGVRHLENKQNRTQHGALLVQDASYLWLWHYPEIGRATSAANSWAAMPWYGGNVFSIQDYYSQISPTMFPDTLPRLSNLAFCWNRIYLKTHK